MGSAIRLLSYLAWYGVFLILFGVGVFGCNTCPVVGPSPLPDAPELTTVCYRPAEPPPVAELPSALGMPSSLPPTPSRPLQMLALSGGVAGAPFTAGVLIGWSQLGTRPTFDRVTGISSGSLIGALAFLGPKYDSQIQHLILTLRGADLIAFRPLRCMMYDGAFGSALPAEKLICRTFNKEFMDDLRRAHAEGRRFFVGTMNLETKRLAVWNLGALASSGRPDADNLVRKVLLAAVSWPGAVQPVTFNIEVNGRCYREEHCDAGSVAMVMPPFGTIPDCPPGSNLFVLASRKLYSDPVPVPKRAFCRLKPSVSAIFEALTRADIGRIHSLCMLSGIRFHLLALPAEYDGEAPSLTHLYPKDAPRLFEMGSQCGMRGPCWRHTPPGAEAGEETLPRDGREVLK
jgi:hypothetical protein